MEKENLIESAKEFIREQMKKNDPSHDYLHVERVYRNAIHIAEAEKSKYGQIDMDVVKLAALFHDLVDFKYDHDHGDVHKSLDDIAHERLEAFFKQFETFPSDKVEHIHYIVMNVSWRKELEALQKGIAQKLTPELCIVRDADRLDAIGAIGVARCLSYSGHKKRPYYEPSEIEWMRRQGANGGDLMSYEEYNKQTAHNQGSALGHFYDKLFFIADRMQTDTGKRLAKERNDFMKTFVEQFLHEMN